MLVVVENQRMLQDITGSCLKRDEIEASLRGIAAFRVLQQVHALDSESAVFTVFQNYCLLKKQYTEELNAEEQDEPPAEAKPREPLPSISTPEVIDEEIARIFGALHGTPD